MHPKHGFRFAIEWVSQVAPNRGMAALIGIVAIIALALLIVPWNNIFPPGAAHPAPVPGPVARVQPLPSPAPTPVITQQVINVTGTRAGAVCVVPTAKVHRPVELVKVP
jgi:hypothetical protein